MPTDLQCRQITDAVNVLRQTHPRQIIVRNGSRVRENLEDYFARLLRPELHRRFPDIDAGESEVVGLMAYLGPADAECPPAPLRDQLIYQVREYTDDLPEPRRSTRLVELALAYGCGWQRSTPSGELRWDGYWPGAVQELTDTTASFVLQTLKTLTDTVRRFNADWNQDRGYAEIIVAEFIGRRLPVDEPRYRHYQTLHTWTPTLGNLYGWLKRAVRGGGSQQGRLQANWFRSGQLFQWLKDDGRLALAKVAFQRCGHCDYVAEYRRSPCPNGHEKTFLFHQTLLVVPGVYTPQSFWRCPKHQYDWQQTPSCRSCHAPRSERPSWRCRCAKPKQRNWLDDVLVCPDCDEPKPATITWTCHNHYYQFRFTQCPDCDAPRPERMTTLLV